MGFIRDAKATAIAAEAQKAYANGDWYFTPVLNSPATRHGMSGNIQDWADMLKAAAEAHDLRWRVAGVLLVDAPFVAPPERGRDQLGDLIAGPAMLRIGQGRCQVAHCARSKTSRALPMTARSAYPSVKPMPS
ncbi:MAG TPA: hypothetical protein VFY11_12595 [Nocardioidaceae bacterium]|nr:hypothetical protein [Nocardioidaceae bacterium]